MKLINPIFQTKNVYSSNFRKSLTSLYKCLQDEIYETINNLGENSDSYKVCINPISIKRIDNKPISDKVLKVIYAKFA
jgi:hypothetical protein